MKIAVAQTMPARGDMAQNIAAHCELILTAVQAGAQLVVFPELSLTGYEPALVDSLALSSLDDPRLNVFQTLSDKHRVALAVGAPVRSSAGVHISLVIFQPQQAATLYSKQHLHADEAPFFAPGPASNGMIVHAGLQAALAICYEISVPQHARNAAKNGAEMYIASVAKTSAGIAQAHARLQNVARENSTPVLMANCAGECDNAQCCGRSAIWSHQGELLCELNAGAEGLIVFDTGSQMCSRYRNPRRFTLVEKLNAEQIPQLHALVQQQWWGGGRTLEEVRKMAQHTSLMLALIETATGQLAGDCRVLTDFPFRATVYDVMVAEHLQGEGLGQRLMDALSNHPEMQSVSLVYLCCETHMRPFYRRWGYEVYEGRAGWMMKVQRAE